MQLSLKKYGWKCVLGAEVAYVLCLLGGFLPLRSTEGVELHHGLFETLPGFTWISFGSFMLSNDLLLTLLCRRHQDYPWSSTTGVSYSTGGVICQIHSA